MWHHCSYLIILYFLSFLFFHCFIRLLIFDKPDETSKYTQGKDTLPITQHPLLPSHSADTFSLPSLYLNTHSFPSYQYTLIVFSFIIQQTPLSSLIKNANYLSSLHYRASSFHSSEAVRGAPGVSSVYGGLQVAIRTPSSLALWSHPLYSLYHTSVTA